MKERVKEGDTKVYKMRKDSKRKGKRGGGRNRESKERERDKQTEAETFKSHPITTKISPPPTFFPLSLFLSPFSLS